MTAGNSLVIQWLGHPAFSAEWLGFGWGPVCPTSRQEKKE